MESIYKVVDSRVRLGGEEKLFVINELKKIKISDYAMYDKRRVIDGIANVIIGKIQEGRRGQPPKQGLVATKTQPRRVRQGFVEDSTEEPDTNAIGISAISFLSACDFKSFALLMNPSLGYKKTTIILDSWYRYVDQTDEVPNVYNSVTYMPIVTKYRWSFVENANIDIGITNTIAPVKNVVAIRLLGANIPEPIDYVNGNNPDRFRLSVSIDEINAQSYILSDTRKAQWLLRYDASGVGLRYDNTEFEYGESWFGKPITHLDKLTVSFGMAVDKIGFITDRNTYTISSYGATTTLTAVSYQHRIPILVKVLLIDSSAPSPVLNPFYATGFTIDIENIDDFTVSIDATAAPAMQLLIRIYDTRADFPWCESVYNSYSTNPMRLVRIYPPVGYVFYGSHPANYFEPNIVKIMVSGFTTNNVVADATAIAAINSKDGFVIKLNSHQTITIPVDTSTVTAKPGMVVTVFFDIFRVTLPMEITYMEDK